MAWVEEVVKRGQKSKYYIDPSTGLGQAIFTVHDQHYKDSNNIWQDVDETLINDTEGFDKKCDKTRHIFKISSGGNRRWYPRRNISNEYVDIIQIQYYTNKWNNLNLPAAVWKSQGAEWDMAYLYASIINTWRQIKTYFILKNSNAPTRLRFAVSFTGLTYNSTTGELTSTTDGIISGYIQKPSAWYGDVNSFNGISVPVTSSYDGTYIEWSVDTTGATFPVYVDPSFIDGFGGDTTTAYDNLVDAAAANTNYGASQFSYSNANPSKILIKFDLSSIPSSATCNSVSFYQYRTAQGTSNPYTITFYSIASGNSGWVEGTKDGLTATAGESCYNYFAYNTVNWAGSVGLGTSGTDYEASSIGSQSGNRADAAWTEYITSLSASRVKNWFGSTNTNYGILLASNTGTGTFASSDYTTGSYRPKLVVQYTAYIFGSSVWGQTTGIQEENIRGFSGNWTGTGMITGSGNSEKVLLSTNNYLESEVVRTGSGRGITLTKDKYGGTSNAVVKYRSASSPTDCQSGSWSSYSGSFSSAGYVQLRLEKS